VYRGLRRFLLTAALLALATAAHAGSGNLIPAPSFNTNVEFLANWENLSVGTWTDLDFEENPFSGSVLVINDSVGADTGLPIISPCLPVTPGTSYQFSAWQYQPSPRLVAGYAQLFLQWRDSCPSGALIGDTSVSSYAFGAWTFVESLPAVAPIGAHGARLWLTAVRTPASGTFSVHFDEAFVPEPDGSASTFAAAASLAALWRRHGSARRDGSRQHRAARRARRT